MKTVTQWFGPDVKPVNPGAYESTINEDGFGAYLSAEWDGTWWRWEDGRICIFQDRTWRGLAEPA
jgi:hypothetical protein